MENPRWVPEILLAYALQSPSGTFTQDFNTNFLRTSNSGTASTELVKVSQNCGSRGLQDPNPPAEAPDSSESRNESQSVQSAKTRRNSPDAPAPNPMPQRR
eukprot:COSAG02_NODE_261_length_26663_cov_210.330899_12_plen_101_part_00